MVQVKKRYFAEMAVLWGMEAGERQLGHQVSRAEPSHGHPRLSPGSSHPSSLGKYSNAWKPLSSVSGAD